MGTGGMLKSSHLKMVVQSLQHDLARYPCGKWAVCLSAGGPDHSALHMSTYVIVVNFVVGIFVDISRMVTQLRGCEGLIRRNGE